MLDVLELRTGNCDVETDEHPTGFAALKTAMDELSAPCPRGDEGPGGEAAGERRDGGDRGGVLAPECIAWACRFAAKTKLSGDDVDVTNESDDGGDGAGDPESDEDMFVGNAAAASRPRSTGTDRLRGDSDDDDDDRRIISSTSGE